MSIDWQILSNIATVATFVFMLLDSLCSKLKAKEKPMTNDQNASSRRKRIILAFINILTLSGIIIVLIKVYWIDNGPITKREALMLSLIVVGSYRFYEYIVRRYF